MFRRHAAPRLTYTVLLLLGSVLAVVCLFAGPEASEDMRGSALDTTTDHAHALPTVDHRSSAPSEPSAPGRSASTQRDIAALPDSEAATPVGTASDITATSLSAHAATSDIDNAPGAVAEADAITESMASQPAQRDAPAAVRPAPDAAAAADAGMPAADASAGDNRQLASNRSNWQSRYPRTPDDPQLPGRAEPVAPAEPDSIELDWGKHRSVITIAEGDGLRRPAHVRTFNPVTGELLIEHGGTAFYDSDGFLHIDARDEPVSGPWTGRWSPDSFKIDAYGSVATIDDISQARNGWTR